MNRTYFQRPNIKLTKTAMARNVIAALYNLSELPLAEDKRVKRIARQTISELKPSYILAHKILSARFRGPLDG